VIQVLARRTAAGSAIRGRFDGPWLLLWRAATGGGMTGQGSCVGGWSANGRPADSGRCCVPRRLVRRRPGTGNVPEGLRQRHVWNPSPPVRATASLASRASANWTIQISGFAAVRPSGATNRQLTCAHECRVAPRPPEPGVQGTAWNRARSAGALLGRLRAGREQTRDVSAPTAAGRSPVPAGQDPPHQNTVGSRWLTAAAPTGLRLRTPPLLRSGLLLHVEAERSGGVWTGADDDEYAG
jgi:hypothetical protein